MLPPTDPSTGERVGERVGERAGTGLIAVFPSPAPPPSPSPRFRLPLLPLRKVPVPTRWSATTDGRSVASTPPPSPRLSAPWLLELTAKRLGPNRGDRVGDDEEDDEDEEDDDKEEKPVSPAAAVASRADGRCKRGSGEGAGAVGKASAGIKGVETAGRGVAESSERLGPASPRSSGDDADAMPPAPTGNSGGRTVSPRGVERLGADGCGAAAGGGTAAVAGGSVGDRLGRTAELCIVEAWIAVTVALCASVAAAREDRAVRYRSRRLWWYAKRRSENASADEDAEEVEEEEAAEGEDVAEGADEGDEEDEDSASVDDVTEDVDPRAIAATRDAPVSARAC